MNLTRRHFLKSCAAAAAAATVLHADETKTYPPGAFVDIHTHITQAWGQKEQLTVEGLLAWMDAQDIAQAVVLPLVSPESWDHPVTTDYVLEQTAGHRDRLIPFCAIDPRTINLGDAARKDLLEKYRHAGAKGLGEHKTGVPIDDPRNLALFADCAEVGLPVLFHLDNQRNTDQPGLPGLENVLKQIPNGVFIGHAQGWWASISGEVTQADLQGYPKGAVAPGGTIDRLMDTYPNLYGDLSAGSGANAIARDAEFGRDFIIRRADRLLFGTDYLAPGQGVPQFDLYNTMNLPDEVKAKVFRENARRILDL